MVPGKVSSIAYNDSEGSCFFQSGRVELCQSGGDPIRSGPVLVNPEGSCFANLEGSKLGGSCFYQSVRVNFCQSGGNPIRRGPAFVNPKGSSFPNPERSKFGRLLYESNRESYILSIWRGKNSEGCCFYQSVRISLEQISGSIGCLFDELIETGEVGFN